MTTEISTATTGVDFRTISAGTARAWLNDAAEVAFFDVREAGQFGEAHPFFAVPLPYSRLELDAPRLAPRRTVRVVLIDGGEPDALAERAARRLVALGYTNVSVVEGGTAGWQAAGYTLFKGINVPSKTFGELVEHAYATPHLSADELARWEREGRTFALLDGRTLEEHTKMTIPGALSCPNGELPLRIDAFVNDATTPIVIHCAGRTRSIIGAEVLRSFGVTNPVIALENGTQGWALAGHALEHGSVRHEVVTNPVHASAVARERAAALARRFAIPALDVRTAQAWLDDPTRTTYAIDVRTAKEFAHDGLRGTVHAPGGQLLQATDQTIGVRGARVLLIDHDGVRAQVIATWLWQLGIDAALIDSRDAAVLNFGADDDAHVASVPKLESLDGDSLRRLVADDGKPPLYLLDLRSSAAYRREHAAGAHWTIRPQLPQALASIGANARDTFLLFADTPAVAELAALDLREAGYTVLAVAADGIDAWRDAELPLEASPDRPTDDARIDYLFFVHDRHEGNLDAARAYLAWETGLIAQCAPDELAAFRIDPRAGEKASAPNPSNVARPSWPGGGAGTRDSRVGDSATRPVLRERLRIP
ncbi:rhodanese-like domain-containing protein [Paraburkholderia megapolitana]|uniref:rhodanese-like domain-containing protein n=1 Tax=Paraburkholderia megapolitana TaxID=420953 RepID=UPI0038B8C1AA